MAEAFIATIPARALSRRFFFAFAAAIVAVPFAGMLPTGSARAASKPKWFTGPLEGVGAGGYDVVAYFAEAKAVSGSETVTAEHDGITWRFASEANRDAFKADPAKYLPQYGGYCAYAVSKGATAAGDPEAWTVHEGKLYLNLSPAIRETWSKDIPGNISKAEANWPKVLE
jgi:YHS domain-containing protein